MKSKEVRISLKCNGGFRDDLCLKVKTVQFQVNRFTSVNKYLLKYLLKIYFVKKARYRLSSHLTNIRFYRIQSNYTIRNKSPSPQRVWRNDNGVMSSLRARKIPHRLL